VYKRFGVEEGIKQNTIKVGKAVTREEISESGKSN
jgi:hypothetical protein